MPCDIVPRKCLSHMKKCLLSTLITPAPVCIIYDTNNFAHLEGPGVFHLYSIEINVKRQSNCLPLKVFNIQRCTAHIEPSTIISKYDSNKCVPFRHNSLLCVKGPRKHPHLLKCLVNTPHLCKSASQTPLTCDKAPHKPP